MPYDAQSKISLFETVSWDENLYLDLSSLGSKIRAPKMWAGSARTRVSCIEPSHGGPLIWDFLKTPRQLVENHQAHVLEWNWHPVVLAWMTSLKESPWQRLLWREFIWGTKSKEQEWGAKKEHAMSRSEHRCCSGSYSGSWGASCG